MQELEFAELDENGRLVVVAEDGTRYAVPVDDRLRAALRPRRAASAEGAAGAAATPREVQAMIRAGQTAEEVATATGWDLGRVQRFEGPVLAEREHVVGLARAAHVRSQGRTDGSHTLERRVRERLQSRGVPPADTRWDAARTGSQGPWTVVVSFTAGGRERQATWHYDVQDRSIDALDDEARWLSEDEQALPGGLAGHPLLGTSHAEDETADLMAAMRERRQARGRRGRRQESSRGEDRARDGGGIDNEPLPLEDLAYDPESMGDPPAAHPRGSAPEAPAPVRPVEDPGQGEAVTGGPRVGAGDDGRPGGTPEAEDEVAQGRDEERGAGRGARARRERRRLRMPKLPPVLGDPEPQDDPEDVAEISYARTHDPQEVSFEEFFGDGEDELDVEGPVDAEPDVDGPVDAEPDVDGRDDRAPGTQAAAAEQDGDATGEADLADADADVFADAGNGTGAAVDADLDVDLDVGQDEPAPDEEQIADGEGSGPDHDRTPDRGPVEASEESPDQDDSPGGSASGRRKGRTSVPSWDDIMFGGGDRRRG